MRNILKYIGITLLIWFVALIAIAFTVGFIRGLK